MIVIHKETDKNGIQVYQIQYKKDYPCTYIIMRVPFLLKAGFSCNVWLIEYINFNSNRNNKL